MQTTDRVVWLMTLACILACLVWGGGPVTSVAYADSNGGEPTPIEPPPDSSDTTIQLPDQPDEPEESTIDILREFLQVLF